MPIKLGCHERLAATLRCGEGPIRPVWSWRTDARMNRFRLLEMGCQEAARSGGANGQAAILVRRCVMDIQIQSTHRVGCPSYIEDGTAAQHGWPIARKGPRLKRRVNIPTAMIRGRAPAVKFPAIPVSRHWTARGLPAMVG